MATPKEKLSASLSILEGLQTKGSHVFLSKEISRTHRERLIKNGFLKEIMKGWLISSHPLEQDGESTSWYASFWEFCAKYCHSRFGDFWSLSPEQSLLLYGENTIIPKQVIIYSLKGTNNKLSLLFDTSLYDFKKKKSEKKDTIVPYQGLRLHSLWSALLNVPASFYEQYPIEAKVCLLLLKDGRELLHNLLEGGNSVVAGRLIGSLRHIGNIEIADEILTAMKTAGYVIRETNPFLGSPSSFASSTPPISNRLCELWAFHRKSVLTIFPIPSKLPTDPSFYLKNVDEIYSTDAYHSLSIEGYKVTPELIQKVKSGRWQSEFSEEDRRNKDALAARGYWQAFLKVKEDVSHVLIGKEPGAIVRNSHRDWYLQLFQPCVAAGIIAPSALAGYRNHAVYLRTSRYVPPRAEVVKDAMSTFFELLSGEPHPGVKAVLGHWLFGYIHPYPDGNGRIARFLMNTMLAAGGYPWAVIHQGDRKEYLSTLEEASTKNNIAPFAQFIARQITTQGTST